MSISVRNKGDRVRLSASFADSSGTAADPDTVTLKVLDPSGNVDSYAYSDSPSTLIRDATGSYYADIDADEEGDWHVRWESTGLIQSAEPSQFVVAPTPF